MRVTIVLVTGAAVAALGCDMARDQGRQAGSDVLIGSEVSCPSCSIVIDNVVTLGGAYYRGGPSTEIARDPDGLFYFVDSADRLLKVHGSDGRFVRQIGRIGAGPGEYETIRNVIAGGDGSIHILDAQLRRRSKFSRDGAFIESNLVPWIGLGLNMPAILLPDNRLVVNAWAQSPSGSEYYPLQVIDQEGYTTHVFGGASLFDPTKQWLHHRLMWTRANGELLVARPFTFVIDVYSSHFTKKLSIRRVADWIPLQDPEDWPSDGRFDKPPTPGLVGMWEDAEGLLWLQIVAPSPSWTPGPPEKRVRTDDERGLELAQRLASRPRLEAIIEVVDLGDYRVLASYRSDSPIGQPFEGGYFTSHVEDATGEPSLRISRARLVR